MSDGIVLIVVHDRPGNLNVVLTSVINSEKYFTPKEGFFFFFFSSDAKSKKAFTRPNFVAKVAKKTS